MFFLLRILLKKSNKHRSINVLGIATFRPFQSEIHLFGLRITLNAIFLRSSLPKQPCLQTNMPSNQWYIAPFPKFCQRRLVMKNRSFAELGHCAAWIPLSNGSLDGKLPGQAIQALTFDHKALIAIDRSISCLVILLLINRDDQIRRLKRRLN